MPAARLSSSRLAIRAFDHAYSAVIRAHDDLVQNLVLNQDGSASPYGFGDRVANSYVRSFEKSVRRELGIRDDLLSVA